MGKNILAPYWRLMRFDKPIGTFLLLWPTLIALWIASHGQPSLKNIIIFVLGVALTRAAGCVINDIADRKFDGLVARTKLRPLAQSELSVQSAIILFLGLMLLAFCLVLQTNALTISLSMIALVLASIYPFMKRITYWPQAVLGLAFSWAIPMVFAAEQNEVPSVAWLLFGATVCLTIAYDTLYAFVDKSDDLKIGIKSTAILFGRSHQRWVAAFQSIALVLYGMAGYGSHLDSPFYIGLLMAILLLIRQHQTLKTEQSYFEAFLNHQWVGFVIFIGTVISLL